jgi:hypothetical protein
MKKIRGVNILHIKKLKIKRKKMVETGARLVIYSGAMMEGWEILLSKPESIEGNHSTWVQKSTRKARA